MAPNWLTFRRLSSEADRDEKNRANAEAAGIGRFGRKTMPDYHVDTTLSFLSAAASRKFRTILADPPWQFNNRTGKVAPEHRRLMRYPTMTLDEIKSLPVADLIEEPAHLYLWVPNALVPAGLEVLQAWGFEFKTLLVWHKIRKDGGSDGRGVGFYFRNVTEIVLFGVRGKKARTLAPGRSQVNLIESMKREHSRKPDELYPIIEACSRGPFLELFARHTRPGWTSWGQEVADPELGTMAAE